jgi:hypothetical protein
VNAQNSRRHEFLTARLVYALVLLGVPAAAQPFLAPELPALSLRDLRMAAPASPDDAADPDGFFSIGKWMLDKRGDVAHWMGHRYHARLLDEPVNVLIRARAANPEAAIRALLLAAKAAGFKPRMGHTNAYQALLESKRLPQQGKTFSDRPFLQTNDHFRLFGPVRAGEYYYFSAAFSREKVDLGCLTHAYVSFQQAREIFVSKMREAEGATIVGQVSLANAIPDDGFQTTGDHDGTAVMLELTGRPRLGEDDDQPFVECAEETDGAD